MPPLSPPSPPKKELNTIEDDFYKLCLKKKDLFVLSVSIFSTRINVISILESRSFFIRRSLKAIYKLEFRSFPSLKQLITSSTPVAWTSLKKAFCKSISEQAKF